MKTISILSMSIAIVAVTLGSCGKEKNKENENTTTICDVSNPLKELSWLKEKIEAVRELVQDGGKSSGEIYQCQYANGKTGFWEEDGNLSFFYNCEGEMLCSVGGFTGKNSCDSLNIDFVHKKLIFKVENGVIVYPEN